MAEVAAAAWAAEEAISTTAQVGVAAYMVSQPTMPLKATFSQIATSSDDETRLSLTRSDHSLTVVGNKAYILGGETGSGKLASTDIQVIKLTPEEGAPDYSVIPAVPDVTDGKLPGARRKHAACSFNVCVAVFGGLDEEDKTIDEEYVWLSNTGKSAWEVLDSQYADSAKPRARSGAKLFNYRNNLVLYGGEDASGKALTDVWLFDYVERTWERLPDAPLSTSNAAVCNGILHLIAGKDGLSSDLHLLELSDSTKKGEDGWHTVKFPTNPLTPGPRPRVGAGLLPCQTGHGRNYLTYLFGARTATETPLKDATAEAGKDTPDSDPPFWSDMWTYQLPSSSPEAKVTTNMSDLIKPAAIKDKIRSALGYETGGHSWAEVEVLPPKDLEASAGKVHPGPRGYFGCDVMEDHKSVVIWGGVNAKGEKEGDGWIIAMQ